MQQTPSSSESLGPWGPRSPAGGVPDVPAVGLATGSVQPREPILNAPWPAVVVVVAILAAYAVQQWYGVDAAARIGAFSPTDLTDGHPWRLVSALFLHGGWAHAGMNAVAALAFGPPVARLLGTGLKGGLAFFAFYLICGILASLGYAAVHWGQASDMVVGASGAISGLMGAASRMYGRPSGMWPVLSRPPLTMAAAWIIVNVLIAVTGLTPGMAGVKMAWEAHIAGFVVGLLLIGPLSRLLRRG